MNADLSKRLSLEYLLREAFGCLSPCPNEINSASLSPHIGQKSSEMKFSVNLAWFWGTFTTLKLCRIKSPCSNQLWLLDCVAGQHQLCYTFLLYVRYSFLVILGIHSTFPWLFLCLRKIMRNQRYCSVFHTTKLLGFLC